MPDIETLAQSLLEFLFDDRPSIELRRFHDDMRLERTVMLVQFPQMQVVHLRHPEPRAFGNECRRLHIARGTLPSKYESTGEYPANFARSESAPRPATSSPNQSRQYSNQQDRSPGHDDAERRKRVGHDCANRRPAR